MNKTNEDHLNETLDIIIKNTDSSDVRILASRMRSDRDFAINALSLFSDLCSHHPFLLDSMNKLFIMRIINGEIN